MSLRQHDPPIRWLLTLGDPSIRYFTLTELLDQPADSVEVDHAHAQICGGRRVQMLLAGQQTDGTFGVHPYQKWIGAHWRLVSLVELGIPADDSRAHAAEQVLRWLTGPAHRRQICRINGLTRRSPPRRAARWRCAAGWG